MKSWMLIGAGAGAALLGYGLLRGIPEIKVLKPLGAAPEDPGVLPRHDPKVIPTHTQKPDDEERAKASYCQLLTAYRQELRLWKTKRDSAKSRMRELERLAEDTCKVYAQSPKYAYKCNGFPFCGLNEWYVVERTITDAEANRLCINAVKGGASLPPRQLTPRSKLPADERRKLADMNREISAAFQQVMELRQRWKKAKADFDHASAKVAEFEKKIRDLEAQGVYC